jgi:predicted Rossmann fold flavoprotein
MLEIYEYGDAREEVSMMEPSWDVSVVGAGAAGLMAALRAAERGRRVLLLEKSTKPGVKILMSGGTRCNITHATDNRGIVAAYGPAGKFLHAPLAALSVQQTIEFFEAEGVAVKVEPTGKIFPVSNKATDVLGALLARLQRSGAILALGEPLMEMTRLENTFMLTTPVRALKTPCVILTSGGQSYPGSGTTGDGYRYAAKFGHTIITPRPALVPLTTNVPWVAELRGLTLEDVGVSIVEDHDKAQAAVLVRRRGSLLFAHFGLSGPVILDISRVVSGHARQETLTLIIDLLPNLSEAALSDFLRVESAASGKKQLAVVVAAHVPRRLAEVVLQQAGLAKDRKAAALSKEERRRLVAAIKQLPIPLTGTLGFKKAEVTAGGIALDEVDSRDMQSKLVPGLFLAGEILDLDGPIGGFNFQAAWSTGWLAGSSV